MAQQQAASEQLLYELMIFNNRNKLIYYHNLSSPIDQDPSTPQNYDYEALNKQTRFMNTVGTAIEVSRLCQSFTPTKVNMAFKCFKTNVYKFSMFETPNSLRFILFSNVKDETDFGPLFAQIFNLYIQFVKRNFLYQQDDVITIPKFREGLCALFNQTQMKRKK